MILLCQLWWKSPIISFTKTLACALFTLLFEIKIGMPEHDVTKYLLLDTTVRELIASTTEGAFDMMC